MLRKVDGCPKPKHEDDPGFSAAPVVEQHRDRFRMPAAKLERIPPAGEPPYRLNLRFLHVDDERLSWRSRGEPLLSMVPSPAEFLEHFDAQPSVSVRSAQFLPILKVYRRAWRVSSDCHRLTVTPNTDHSAIFGHEVGIAGDLVIRLDSHPTKPDGEVLVSRFGSEPLNLLL
jgi:hypothetical protein